MERREEREKKREILGERLFCQLNFILDSKGPIDEYSILPSPPPPFLSTPSSLPDSLEDQALLEAEGKMAVMLWVTPVLLSFVSSMLRKDPPLFCPKELVRCQLLMNGNHNTGWNRRKKDTVSYFSSLFSQLEKEGEKGGNEFWEKVFGRVEEEVKFINLVLTKFRKSNEIWSHRRWMILSLLQLFTPSSSSYPSSSSSSLPRPHSHSTLSSFRQKIEAWGGEEGKERRERLLSVILGEFESCHKFAQIYPRNFYAWSYRTFLLSFLFSESEMWIYRILTREDLLKILVTEKRRLEVWKTLRVSDFSAMHYYSLVDSIFVGFVERETIGEVVSTVKDNIEKVGELFQEYSMHESLWCYRRSLLRQEGREQEGEGERMLNRELHFCYRWLPQSLASLLKIGEGKREGEGGEGGSGFEVQAEITRLGNPARHALFHLIYCLLFLSPCGDCFGSLFDEKIITCLCQEIQTPNFTELFAHFKKQKNE